MKWQVSWASSPGRFTTMIVHGDEERDLYSEIDRLGIASCEIKPCPHTHPRNVERGESPPEGPDKE